MKYYESDEDCYREFRKLSESFADFYMNEYLVTALDRIKPVSNARVLEVVCGTIPHHSRGTEVGILPSSL